MTTSHEPKYNLSIPEVIEEMEVQLKKMQAEPDRNQLHDVDPDTAYEKGYEVAIFDLKHLTGPNPREESE